MRFPQTFPLATIRFASALLLAAMPTPLIQASVNRWSSGGPAVPGVTSVAVDPQDPEVLYAGSTRGGVFKSGNGGLSWDDLSSGKLDGISVHSVAVDPRTSSTIYAGTARGILKSTDGGASWADSLAAGAIYNLIFAPQSSTIYAADFDDVAYYPGPSTVYKSEDDGRTWSSRSRALTIVPGTLLLDPARPSVLYAANYYSGIFKSEDSGSTWSQASPDLVPSFVSALAMDPRDSDVLYAATSNGLYRSMDAGASWRLTHGDLRGVGAMTIDPRNPRTLYASRYSRGVFRSVDGGASWNPFNFGLTELDIVTLAIDPTGKKLHVASRTGGVFDYQISTGALDLSLGLDDAARVLFAATDGRLFVRGVDSAGNVSSAGPYGPYDGWNSKAVAEGSDGLTRVLWTSDDGSAALWLLGPQGNQASYRLGPAAGWTAVDVAASGAGTTDLLWSNFDGRIALWRIDNAGGVSPGPISGPYPGWTAVAAADGKDGLARVLWNRTDGLAGLSLHGTKGLLASYQFGPVAGWTANDIAVGADGQTRILWTHQDGRMALWRVDDAGNPTALGPIYSPPPGLTASRISAGADGRTRVLWSGTEDAVLWVMSADNVFVESIDLGAFDADTDIAGRLQSSGFATVRE